MSTAGATCEGRPVPLAPLCMFDDRLTNDALLGVELYAGRYDRCRAVGLPDPKITRAEYAAACGVGGIEPLPEILADLPDTDDGLRRLEIFERPAAGSRGSFQEHAQPEEMTTDAYDTFKSHALTRSALLSLPKPDPFITGTFNRRSVIVLAGAENVGKSFVALDWAASIATGTPWLGRPAESARVLYVLGEGAHGMGDRLLAWEAARGVTVGETDLIVYDTAIQLTDAAARDLLKAYIAEQGFDLVILDTLARMAVGLDENSADAMGRLIDASDDIRRATPSGSVVLVHHVSKADRGALRGSSALSAGVDTVYIARGTGEATLSLTRTKQKDGKRDDTLDLQLVPHADAVVPELVERMADPDAAKLAEACRVLAAHDGPMTPKDLRTALSLNNEVARRILDGLERRGLAESSALLNRDGSRDRRGRTSVSLTPDGRTFGLAVHDALAEARARHDAAHPTLADDARAHARDLIE
ncbi:AAA family ATPase [Allobranchiibius sp. GilTou38]|uniref:AAA family ATPase n=1 Tax=Allobranchiibius sp. GilTou38 TaxID=2815210 RepID=UPI001AA10117|nr:AAA family ATPase [Allobranchiibius sp. GilTou38]MBO1765777.1 AAA family ATPase [Allobranchiibius sp. GilTou38]